MSEEDEAFFTVCPHCKQALGVIVREVSEDWDPIVMQAYEAQREHEDTDACPYLREQRLG